MTANAFTVEARGWTFLGRRYVIMCEDVDLHESRSKGMAENLCKALNQAYGLGFLDGRGYALKEAAEMVKSGLEKP